MSQYAYILVVISLVFLFLVNKYEKEKLQRLLQDQLLKTKLFVQLSKKKSKQQKTSTMSLTTSIKDIVWES